MKDGGPVYPQIVEDWDTCGKCKGEGSITHEGSDYTCNVCGGNGRTRKVANHTGMSLRDHFAAAALQGLMSNRDYHLFDGDDINDEHVAQMAYRVSDAMLKAREQS